MPSPSAALARHQARYLTNTFILTIAYVLVPFFLIAYFSDAFAGYLRSEGYAGAVGDELVVPGVATLYAYLVLVHDGAFSFSEHAWHAWDRVRAAASTSDIVKAKVGTAWVHIAVQSAAIFAGGIIFFDFPLTRDTLLLVPVMIATVTAAVAYGCLGFAVCSTNAAYDAWCYGGGIVLAAIGGAISPLGLLPSAVQRVAPVSPVYWMMKAAREVTLDHLGFAAALRPTIALALFATVFFVAAGLLFDPSAEKAGRLR